VNATYIAKRTRDARHHTLAWSCKVLYKLRGCSPVTLIFSKYGCLECVRMEGRYVLPVFFLFLSNATLGDHRNELNWTLRYIRKWTRFENGFPKFEFAVLKTWLPKTDSLLSCGITTTSQLERGYLL